MRVIAAWARRWPSRCSTTTASCSRTSAIRASTACATTGSRSSRATTRCCATRSSSASSRPSEASQSHNRSLVTRALGIEERVTRASHRRDDDAGRRLPPVLGRPQRLRRGRRHRAHRRARWPRTSRSPRRTSCRRRRTTAVTTTSRSSSPRCESRSPRDAQAGSRASARGSCALSACGSRRLTSGTALNGEARAQQRWRGRRPSASWTTSG